MVGWGSSIEGAVDESMDGVPVINIPQAVPYVPAPGEIESFKMDDTLR